jgi:hypothetical protein
LAINSLSFLKLSSSAAALRIWSIRLVVVVVMVVVMVVVVVRLFRDRIILQDK